MNMKDTVLVIRGEVNWAKIVGKARPYTGNPKYDKGPYWSVDITPNEASRKLIRAAGIESKLREPKGEDKRTETFLTLRVLEDRADGSKNNPPKVTDIEGKAWGEDLIGNGSVCDIMVKVKDYGSGSEKGTYLQSVRVLDLVPYEGGDLPPISEDDEYFAKAKAAKADKDPEAAPKQPDAAGHSGNIDDLDDDIPF